jgi:hypothetical protein
MIASSLIALAVFGFGQPPMIKTHAVRVRPWTIEVRTDRFTGLTACSARMKGVRLEGTLAVFDLGRDVDASDALYRLDLGAAHSARGSNITERTAYSSVQTPDVENPSGGRIALPIAELAGVKRIDIRPNPKHYVQTYDISALPKVLDAESAAGCPSTWTTPASSATATEQSSR